MPANPRLALLLFVCAGQSACSLLFPTEAGESLSHYDVTAPSEAAPAPEFQLADIDGNEVALYDLVGEKPVVVQLGSYSCPVFRYRRFDVQKLQREFAGRVDFVVVYTLEAHPFDGINPYEARVWNPLINRAMGVHVPEHKSLDERRARAAATSAAVELNSRFLVDGMDNAVWRQYGAAPSAAYVLDLQGIIRLRQPWVYPKEIRKVLNEILTE
ncbi:MAG: redoxin domain-containing protein [Gammaproteobacteria bacterium]|nr:redoxin domain-containing protein [Gammaproteobacteria bacterium]MDH3372025.1 redoxin domain-containing protein [Gammaproteobacteria bacterium]MDH3410206.1 redoxin domain-containing protein [Gammaproteobacteria bacterium]